MGVHCQNTERQKYKPQHVHASSFYQVNGTSAESFLPLLREKPDASREMMENLVNPNPTPYEGSSELARGLMVPTHPLGDPLLTYVKTFNVTSKAVLFCFKAADSL